MMAESGEELKLVGEVTALSEGHRQIKIDFDDVVALS